MLNRLMDRNPRRLINSGQNFVMPINSILKLFICAVSKWSTYPWLVDLASKLNPKAFQGPVDLAFRPIDWQNPDNTGPSLSIPTNRSAMQKVGLSSRSAINWGLQSSPINLGWSIGPDSQRMSGRLVYKASRPTISDGMPCQTSRLA